MTRLLVVDDEERICRVLGRALRAAGYEVDCASSGPAALQAVRAHEYDLIVLDLMLPGVPGEEILRRLLADEPSRPVLVLSAVTGIEARVGCLEAGAADFLPKPFALAELRARIRSRIREPRPTAPAAADVLRVGAIELDPQRRVIVVGGDRRTLSDREYALLLHLMQHAGEVCTREQLLSDVWGYNFDPGTNIVDVYVRRLRAKLGDLQRIETIRNVGYSLVAT
jgi:two-component system, OmpR family, response regulator